MNRQLLPFLFLLLLAPGLKAQVQYTTELPRVDDTNDPDVSIQRIELTPQYTILYMTHQTPKKRRSPFQIPLPNGGDGGGVNTIGFQPTARLYVNQGERSYKFIRAENIPLQTRMKVLPGDRVDFVVYFERIDPGYTTFDLYECKDHDTYTCFNFWGVHVINPARKPKPQPPRLQPRTSPGVGTTPPPVTPAPPVTPPPSVSVASPVASPVAIKGSTRDAKTQKTIAATVTYRLVSGAEIVADGRADSVRSDGTTGQYTIPVDRRGVYILTASAKGYFSLSDTLATNRVSLTRNFQLIPIEAGATITLRNIYFNASQFDLQPESFPELDRLVGVMRENPTMSIRLEGHTDTVGDFDANVELSRNRVNEVKRYLVSKGIGAGRIETVGYGPSRPINTNKSLKERPENRRVEMVITKA